MPYRNLNDIGMPILLAWEVALRQLIPGVRGFIITIAWLIPALVLEFSLALFI
ncbi:MAG: hypothetical protein LBL76_05065 [Treponema sp.]|jgi:hypothetical protein|nr:hypothetical protein [Treponema sp.]